MHSFFCRMLFVAVLVVCGVCTIYDLKVGGRKSKINLTLTQINYSNSNELIQMSGWLPFRW